MNLHQHTPVWAAPAQYSAAGKPLWLKMDALQASGSFKLRGVGRLCAHEVAQGAKAIVCASGGNAGFAAAYCGAQLGVAVTIVVPHTTALQTRQAIAATGATVEVQGSVWDEAHTYAKALATRLKAAYVHPFDHPLLWDGHATLIDEMVADQAKFDCVVVSVGGGGLLCGVIEGLRRNRMWQIPVIAVETLGADCLTQSVAVGKLLTLPAITSIATSLGARQTAQRAFDLAREHPVHCVTVSDTQAVAACRKFANTFRVLVEPACGAALAALDVHPALFAPFNRPLVEVCGGIGVTLDKLQQWQTQLQS